MFGSRKNFLNSIQKFEKESKEKKCFQYSVVCIKVLIDKTLDFSRHNFKADSREARIYVSRASSVNRRKFATRARNYTDSRVKFKRESPDDDDAAHVKRQPPPAQNQRHNRDLCVGYVNHDYALSTRHGPISHPRNKRSPPQRECAESHVCFAHVDPSELVCRTRTYARSRITRGWGGYMCSLCRR